MRSNHAWRSASRSTPIPSSTGNAIQPADSLNGTAVKAFNWLLYHRQLARVVTDHALTRFYPLVRQRLDPCTAGARFRSTSAPCLRTARQVPPMFNATVRQPGLFSRAQSR
jgi:hypothetical protein